MDPMSTRDEYVAAMKQRLDAWSTYMAVLEAKAHQTKEDAKEKYLRQQCQQCHAAQMNLNAVQ